MTKNLKIPSNGHIDKHSENTKKVINFQKMKNHEIGNKCQKF